MRNILLLLIVVLFSLESLAVEAVADATEPATVSATGTEPEPAPRKHGVGHKILMYIPNRVIDLVDIFRLRLRVGPGVSATLRATAYAPAYVGVHKTAFVGLPGPRKTHRLRSPIGLESRKGIEMLVDATDDSAHDAGYSPTEVVIGAQLLLVGAEGGVDAVEIGDFIAGFLFFDPRGDDL